MRGRVDSKILKVLRYLLWRPRCVVRDEAAPNAPC